MRGQGERFEFIIERSGDIFTFYKASHCCGESAEKNPNNFDCKSDCLMEYTRWNNLQSVTHMKTGKEIEIVRVIRHPDYDPSTLKNDICLIKEQLNF